ncbi:MULTISPECIES: stalk domain-containing protein [unclassified Paenibacillus]|uniref:stalk domain-containing protein n=1 Tax=unclassified Paenibacillus TaxID=185978 RepID=UPI00362EC2A8
MRKIIIVLSIILIIGSAATAVAASAEAVQATVAKFVFKVNGVEKELKNSPLVVDGTSYLPVREVADLLGYELGYEETTGTISFEQKQAKSNPYQELTEAPDLSEWINVLDLIRFYEGNDIKASLSGDHSVTNLNIGAYGIGFPFSFEDQYKQGDVPKLYQKYKGKLSMLVYKNNIHVNKSNIKDLGFPIEDEWMPAADLTKTSTKFDFSLLNGVGKLKPVFLYTEQGIIRAMNSKTGILLNKEDLKARGLIS